MILDIQNEDFIQNPYPFYQKMRSIKEPIKVKQPEGLSSIENLLLFSRYEDAIAIYKETKKISNDVFRVRENNETNTIFKHMVNSDGEDHSRLRASVSKYFTLDHIRHLENIIQTICDDLIDKIIQKNGKVDLIAEYAEKIPLLVIAKHLGMDDADLDKLRKWTKIIGSGLDVVSATQKDVQNAQAVLLEFLAYIKAYVENRKKHPKNLLIDDLIKNEKEGIYNQQELYSMIAVLFIGGHETTINLIGNGIWLLLSHPQQLAMIKKDFDLIPNAIEEILRYETPVQRSSFRITVEPVEINGFFIEKNTPISIALGSVNRDEKIFNNPDKFDILRSPNPHLSFGFGMHNCLGKHLSKFETKIAFERLFTRLDDIKLLSKVPNFSKKTLFRGHEKLEVLVNSK